ncbi:MAG: hypothetical protein ABSC64_02215 [Candidatus Korobacteraceae bacterium]
MALKNKMAGFVEIDIDADRKFLDLPVDEPIYLKYDYNAIALADDQLKRASGVSLLYILTHSATAGTGDLRILLAEGLRHQFPGITKEIAGKILGYEKFPKILVKVIEAASFVMEDWFDGQAAKDLSNMRVRAVAISGREDEAEEILGEKN